MRFKISALLVLLLFIPVLFLSVPAFSQDKIPTPDTLSQTVFSKTVKTVADLETLILQDAYNLDAMGAIGIAMLAGESIKEQEDSGYFNLEKIISAQIMERRTFRCKDSKCKNLCRVEAATIEVMDTQRKVISGGSSSFTPAPL